MDKKLLNKINFSIEPVTEIQQINPIISKARVRIFYTGLNRNLTYITEEFAEKLLKTLPYTPVGGLWEEALEDFTDHGGANPEEREKLRVFGVVPENPNVGWEEHLDCDGVLRRYACCDVYLWTARFKAAREIPKKAQSMELYMGSIQGKWKRDGAVEYYEFTDGCFFGLVALGDDVEPCFEGAAFYGLDSSAKEFFEELKNYTLSATKEHIGGTEMEKDLEQIVEETPVVEDEAVETPAEETVEEPAEETVETVEEGEETEETVEETEEVETPAEETEEEVDTAAEETTADDAGADTFAEVEEDDDDENNDDDEEDETVNYQAQIEQLQTQISEYENTITELRTQVEELASYRNNAENTRKTELINKYSSLLGEEIASEYTSKVSDYTFDELKRDISVKILDINEEALFTKGETKETVTDVDVSKNYSGAERLMSKYFKNK
jgi:hypothetical protein